MIEQLEKLEQLRKKAANYRNTGWVIIAIFFFLSFIPFSIFIGLICGGIFFGRSTVLFKQYSQGIKELWSRDVFAEYFDEFSFSEKQGLLKSEIDPSGLIANGVDYGSEDLLTAKHKGLSFRQADMKIKRRKRSASQPSFNGQWVIIDLPKHVAGRVRIRPKVGYHFYEELEKENKEGLVQLDHKEFNELFVVDTMDEHEAYYFLTPHLMDKMLHAREGAQSHYYSLVGNQLHIAIYSTKDLYEPPRNRPVSGDYFDTIRNDIEFILGIIEELV